MTVYLYSGTPGSGKSLHAANDLRFALNRRKPRPVIGNFPINTAKVRHPEMYHYLPNEQLKPDWLFDFADRWWDEHPDDFGENKILLIIDECQLLFNARTWSSKDRLAFLEFFSQHRKAGYKVILVAQNAKMVDNQFRMLIEYDVIHRKMSESGLVGWLLGLPFGGRLFVRVLYYYQLNERLSADWYIGRRADMELYDTHARFERARDDRSSGPDPSA